MKQPDRPITVEGKHKTAARAQAYADKLRKRGWDARVNEMSALSMNTLQISPSWFIVEVHGILPR